MAQLLPGNVDFFEQRLLFGIFGTELLMKVEIREV